MAPRRVRSATAMTAIYLEVAAEAAFARRTALFVFFGATLIVDGPATVGLSAAAMPLVPLVLSGGDAMPLWALAAAMPASRARVTLVLRKKESLFMRVRCGAPRDGGAMDKQGGCHARAVTPRARLCVDNRCG